jgi:uncharacterized repeat protein (TIGR03803 family)
MSTGHGELVHINTEKQSTAAIRGDSLLNTGFRTYSLSKQTRIALTLAFVLSFIGLPLAHAQTLTVLYQFTGGLDGASPYRGSLFLDKTGNIFGATANGGDTTCNPPFGCGVVFKIDTDSSESVLHTFSGSPDGAEPYAGVIANPAGGEYALAEYGGTSSCTPGRCSLKFSCCADSALSPRKNGPETYIVFTGEMELDDSQLSLLGLTDHRES